jgi:hypothetical protein
MSDPGDLQELIDYLVRTSRLTPREAAHVVGEVLEFLNETPEAYIRRRHYALQAEGLSNPVIFVKLAEEVARWRFSAPRYSARQIRRIIYG